MEASGIGPLIGESVAFRDAVAHASRAAAVARPVLVIGERGTGKELFANRLHFLSPRWEGPFITVNCAALSESLLDAELFGYEAGAFTGAVRARPGRFSLADGGTLFLDEIANASAAVQEKLLRVIEYGRFDPLGSSTTLSVDVRVVAATNVDLPALVTAGRFRGDLLDRLSFDVITVPPLRARREDIPPLAEHFAIGMARDLNHAYFPGFAPSAMTMLTAHDWPGNVRELKNTVERAVYANPDPQQPVADIVIDPFASPYRPAGSGPAEHPAPAPAPQPPDTAADPVWLPPNLHAHLRAEEARLVSAALEQHRYNQKQAAAALGLTYNALRHLLRKHNLLPLRPNLAASKD